MGVATYSYLVGQLDLLSTDGILTVPIPFGDELVLPCLVLGVTTASFILFRNPTMGSLFVLNVVVLIAVPSVASVANIGYGVSSCPVKIHPYSFWAC
jgi:hypothetical protein